MTEPRRTPIESIERMRNVLAFSLVAAFVGALISFSLRDIPKESKDIITYMVGQLSGMATMALGFYFVNKVGQDALDAARAENTGKMADLATTALKSADKGGAAEQAAAQVADAAVDAADEIKAKT